MNELELKLENDHEIVDDFAEVAEMVEFHWKGLAEIELDAGYATEGTPYKDSIHRTSVRTSTGNRRARAPGKAIGGRFL